jgi:hypothetical protein
MASSRASYWAIKAVQEACLQACESGRAQGQLEGKKKRGQEPATRMGIGLLPLLSKRILPRKLQSEGGCPEGVRVIERSTRWLQI